MRFTITEAGIQARCLVLVVILVLVLILLVLVVNLVLLLVVILLPCPTHHPPCRHLHGLLVISHVCFTGFLCHLPRTMMLSQLHVAILQKHSW